jgi:uncharacterized protein YkwD
MRNFKFLLCRSPILEFLPAVLFLLFVSFPAAAQSPPLQRNESERQLFEALNRERLAQGFASLQWDESLFKAARRHALRMANLNMLEHQLPSEPKLEERFTEAGARFSIIGENIALGPNPNTIHNGWMESPGHRKNILDARFNAVGIAAVRGTGGLFAVQDFSHSVSNLSVEEQEKQVSSLLVARGFQISGGAEDARRSCESHKPNPGSGVRSMMWFETTDLTTLPDGVERKIRSESFRKATVGACQSNGGAGFARYRIAVLFF